MYLIHKNSVKVATADIAGITNTNNVGETNLGTDFFTGEELADTDEVLSIEIVCDRCGRFIKEKSELTKQAGFKVCKRCFDE